MDKDLDGVKGEQTGQEPPDVDTDEAAAQALGTTDADTADEELNRRPSTTD